jgi:hypothetical protein
VSSKPSKTVTKSTPKAAARSATKQPRAPAFNTPGELAAAFDVKLKPSLKPKEILRLRKALPGYSSSLDDTARRLTHDREALGFDEADSEKLLDLQERHEKLRRAETVLETVHLSVYHQRLQIDDEAMGLLQRIVRRVQSRAEEDPQLPLRWGALLDFMGAFRKGGGRAAAPVEPSEPAEPTGDDGDE